MFAITQLHNFSTEMFAISDHAGPSSAKFVFIPFEHQCVEERGHEEEEEEDTSQLENVMFYTRQCYLNIEHFQRA